ncbi:MAG: oligoendopeptidase F [Candidatus Izemoplasmatales bacterium]
MKWNLTYLFADQAAFDKGYNQSLGIIKKLGTYKGKLADPEMFRAYFTLQIKLNKVGLRVYQYASLKSDLNKKDLENAKQLQMVQIAFAQLAENCSFEEPELLSLGKDVVLGMVDKYPEIAEFKFNFEKLFRRQEHVLDDASEALLANFNRLAQAGRELYSSLSVADIQNGDVMLDSGEIVTITNSNYRSFIAKSQSPKEREEIFESVYSYYDVHKNTYASIYKAVLEADNAFRKARRYATSLESRLFNDAIPVAVYHNLAAVARETVEPIKKYIELRKKALGLEVYHTYDRFLDLVKTDKEYEYEEARELFFKSIEKFPADFRKKAKEVLADGFVDVYEAEGKRTGAYSSSMPDLHPFILLNYSKTLADVFTVAHEAGHSIHSMYAAEGQPATLQDYTIFVAEVASTFNEHNLLDYFIKESKASRNEKIALLQRAIDDILSTFYRQTLFACYELESHRLVEAGEPITSDTLSKIMIDLYQEFYGIDISKENLKPFVWAYIPHLFYTPFYVYQYATSFAASLKLYENVKEGKKGAFEKYVGLLKSGGSAFPVDQLKKAGIDLTKKDAFRAVSNRLSELVDQLAIELEAK